MLVTILERRALIEIMKEGQCPDDAAVANLLEAIDLSSSPSDKGRFHYQLAMCYRMQFKLEKAAEQCELAISLLTNAGGSLSTLSAQDSEYLKAAQLLHSELMLGLARDDDDLFVGLRGILPACQVTALRATAL
jgi:tetratricopeptide (TPR) repeat protein